MAESRPGDGSVNLIIPIQVEVAQRLNRVAREERVSLAEVINKRLRSVLEQFSTDLGLQAEIRRVLLVHRDPQQCDYSYHGIASDIIDRVQRGTPAPYRARYVIGLLLIEHTKPAS